MTMTGYYRAEQGRCMCPYVQPLQPDAVPYCRLHLARWSWPRTLTAASFTCIHVYFHSFVLHNQQNISLYCTVTATSAKYLLLFLTYIHTYIAVYCIIEQHISNNENKADKKQIQRGQVKLVQLNCLRLVPETFQCVTTNCNSNGVSIKVDCPCRYI